MLKPIEQQADSATLNNISSQPQIWAVASGKGGVGKSFIASNLGLAVALDGRRAVVVDLDLGGANLHTHLAIPRPKHSLSHFIHGKVESLNEIVDQVGDSGLGMISGASDHLDIANLKHFQKQKVMRHLRKLDTDIVILDLGAGTTYNTLDFFNIADQGIISVIPEPTSIENSHRFLKCATYRNMRNIPDATKSAVTTLLGRSPDKGSLQTLREIIAAVEKRSMTHAKVLKDEIQSRGLHLVINQVRNPGDFQLGYSMALVWKQFYGRKPDSLSFLNYDEAVVQSLCDRVPFLLNHANSRNGVHLKHLVRKLLISGA